MTLSIAAVLALIVFVSLVLITDKIRADLVALLLLSVLGLSGLVKPQDLFSGFSRPAVVTILALFIISAGLERTGATRLLGQRLNRLAGGSETRAIIVVMIAAAVLSLTMNTIAAAAVLLPVVIGISRHSQLRPSKLLLPLAFGALLGGMATLFTTSNLLVSAALVDQGLPGYGVLDFLPVGLPMALAGIVFMAVLGRRWLPEHGLGGPNGAPRVGTLADTYGLKETVHAVVVRPGSAMASLTLAEGGWGERLGLNVVGLSRGGHVHLAPEPGEELLEGDLVLFTGFIDQEELNRYGLAFADDPHWRGQIYSDQVSLVEVVLTPRSLLAGRTLREMDFREKFDLSVLALWREGIAIREGVGDIALRFGDALLIQGRHSKIVQLRASADFIVLEEDTTGPESPLRAWLAVALTTAAVVLPALNLLPIAETALTAAALMVLFGCLTMDEAYAQIEWKAIFLIVGMLPLGLAMTGSGTSAFVGDALVRLLGAWGPLALAGGLYVATTLLTQVMSGQATAVVLAPVAIAAARQVGVDPRGMAMAVAMGCSTAFLTPISHSANLLVMGPGGYKFRDYSRVGLPLTMVLFLVLLLGLAVFWGIR